MMNHAETLVTAALRSGEFDQGCGALRRAHEREDSSSWCCLGVATEIYRRETGNGTWAEDSDPETGARAFHADGAYSGVSLLDPVREWLEWERGGPLDFELAHLNDEGVPFHEIADIIENQRAR